MDRSWVNGRKFTKAHVDGTKEFMDLVRQKFGKNIPVHCPCRRCLNQTKLPQKEINEHILLFGMSATYTRWILHGESADTQVVEHSGIMDDPCSGDGIEMSQQDEDGDMEMPDIDIVADLYTAAEKDGKKPMFSKVLDDLKQTLCPGSSQSRFSFLVRLLHIKSRYRISNTGFDALLKLLSSSFPLWQLPASYEQAKKYLHELGLGYESIHVCKNNCVLFRNQYVKLDDCPICKESRWKDNDGNKRVPHKVLRHFPLIPRLKRLFASSKTAEDTQWHQKKRTPIENVMSHPADGEAWKHFDRKYKNEFANDPRNLRLAVASDGFNPFGNFSTTYSMWPVLVTPLNLPPWECVNPSNCLMSLLIPGPASPGKDFDLFLEPLIEELLELWKGVRTYDAFSDSMFDLHAAVLWCVHDFPALSTMSGRTTKGYQACTHCDIDPLSRAVRRKIGYIGHRRYLPMEHPWRRSLAFDGLRETKEPPRKFTIEEVYEQLEKVKDVRPGKFGEGKKRKRDDYEERVIYTRKSAWWKLPYWKDLLLPHILDVMHIENNICDNITCTLMKVEGKTKDNTNARLDLYDMGIRPELHCEQNGSKVKLPPAWYVLTPQQRIEFCNFLKGIKFPDGFAANLASNISQDSSKFQGRLKTHSCHVLLQRIIPAGLRGLVHKDVYEALAELGNFFRELCSKTLRIDVVKRLKKEIPIILCKLERIFPPAFFTVMVHLAVHLPDEALLRGPVQYGWMYPIERRLGTLKNFVSNKARPEGSIAEAYIASETLAFCSRYMEDCDTRSNPQEEGDISVFMHGAKLSRKSRVQYIDDEIMNKLVWYVLNNCEEVEPYLDIYKKELEKEGETDDGKSLEKGFAKWFKTYIKKLRKEKPDEVSEGLYALSVGPDLRVKFCRSCIVNGVLYRTVDREKNLRTQNSGVMVEVEGSHDDKLIEFYGVLKEVIELQYNSNLNIRRSVVLFRCDWYNLHGKTVGLRDDGHFKSVNIQSFWYKSEPFILATQPIKIFYLQDTSLGKSWRVVQKFEHRGMYNVPEYDVHQDDYCSDSEHTVQEGEVVEVMPHVQNGEETVIEANLEELIKNKKQVDMDEFEDDEDDTLHQYSSDSDNGHDVDYSSSEDDL